MKILDLRPLAVRLWERRDRDELRSGGPAERLAGALGDALVRARVARRDPPPPGLTVVSVGNLAFGGTGKTPVVAALAEALAAAGYRGGVLTRGYGSGLPGPALVHPDDLRAGDEARLLASALGPLNWPVVQARRRRAGLRRLGSMLPPGAVVLLEDGHQTAGVGRQLDVLILDRWTVGGTPGGPRLQPASGPVVPCGPWRETAAGAQRAGIWLVEAESPPAFGGSGVPVAGFVRELTLVNRAGEPWDPLPEPPWLALSGIARPARFEAGVAAFLQGPALLAIRCADHAPYAGRLRQRIVAAVRQVGSPLTVTTEKDWIKLRDHWPADLPLAVARLRVRWTGRRPLPELVRERLVQPGGGSR